jgi:capsular exopolysaccharide synthesis family protein
MSVTTAARAMRHDGGIEPVLAGIIAALRRRRGALLLVVVAFPALAYLAASQITPHYTATGSVMYEPEDYAAQELQSVLRADPMTDAVMTSQAEIMRSLGAAAEVVSAFQLSERAEFNPALRPPGRLDPLRRFLPAWIGGGPVTDSGPRLLLAVQAAIGVQVLRNSRVLEVSFTSTDPRLAAAAANTIMKYYLSEQVAAKVAAVRRASTWLDERVAALRAEVARSEDRIAAYRVAHGLMPGVQSDAATEQLSRLSAALSQAKSDLAQVLGRGAKTPGHAAHASVALSVAPLRAQADQLAAQLQAMLARLGPNHPETIALRQQAADAERSVAAEVARENAANEGEVQAARARVAALQASLDAAQARMDQALQAQIPLNAMERDAEAARALLQSVQERAQQTAQLAALERPDARIVSQALPPSSPSEPRLGWIVGIAAIGGLFCGLALVYALEVNDQTVKSGDELRAQCGLPCFALVPQLRRRQLGRLRVVDYVAHRPFSPFAEQMRALRAGLSLGGAQPKVIAITAARPSEGKTVSTIGLGRVVAMSGERVLLIDCDIREPALGRLLDADAEAGLSDVLMGSIPLDDVVRQDALTTMHFLPAGSPQANSLALFMSDAMVALINAARAHFDVIVLDVPPVLAIADARVLARLADATLVCVRWRGTPWRILSHSLRMLEEAQALVAGTVLTRVDAAAYRRSGAADSEVYHPRYGGYFVE